MGLDTTHECWNGSYIRFSAFRNALAEAAGYSIQFVKYPDGFACDTVMIDWGHLPEGVADGDWPEIPADPLLVLIVHSDCDGLIKAEHCAPLADRIDELIPALAEEWVVRARKFRDGLRLASKEGEDVEFF